MQALHYANELLARVRLTFQKLLQNRSTYRNNAKKKNVWEKNNDAYWLSIRVQTVINHIFVCFFTTISTSKKMFSFRARAEKGIARHIDVFFYWFVLSMRMQVILDSSFALPGSAPTWGGKKGEFRDWTRKGYNSSFRRFEKKN